MKKLLIIALLCASQQAFSDQLVTVDGTIYQNAKIVSASLEYILIIYDGGGCQLEYTDLKTNSLTAQQVRTIENELKVYSKRQVRLKEFQKISKEQRAKGLVLFEGSWMKPSDRQDILSKRERLKLERERLRVELVKQKTELEKARLLAGLKKQRVQKCRKPRRIYIRHCHRPRKRVPKACPSAPIIRYNGKAAYHNGYGRTYSTDYPTSYL